MIIVGVRENFNLDKFQINMSNFLSFSGTYKNSYFEVFKPQINKELFDVCSVCKTTPPRLKLMSNTVR